MPGRLVMDQHAVQGSDGLKKDPNATPAQTNGSNSHFSPPMSGTESADFASEKPGTKSAPPLVNGTLPDRPESHGNGILVSEDQPPPELEKWAHTYTPMSVLYPRVGQQCYSDLVELIDVLAEMPVQQGPPAVNGATNHDVSHTMPDKSATSIEKKLRLMNFAHEQRNRFIKLLVLTDWARNMTAMDKLIELRMWLSKQDDASTQVANAIVQLKHNMIPAKMPNPNIQGALELLSTGKAPWMPDLGYIPPKRLTPGRLLKTLKDMNFLLSVRLNVHEELPSQFRNYSIANGRATFVVQDEFEVDFALADEDPQSPFYFIDMRLLFSTSRQIPEGPVRHSIEAKVNEILANDGLSASYSYLHDFALTHRTNLLRRQAFEMARSKWSECIRVETIHRDFVVQYWTGRPGPKSWVHIGTLSSTASSTDSLHLSRPSRTGLRWMKEGQDSTVEGFEVDNLHHSMELILEQILGTHVDQRLLAINIRLRALSGKDSVLACNLKLEGSNLRAKSLEMRFGASRVPLELRISLVTGKISITPPTAITMDAEQKLNNTDLNLDMGQIIIGLHCKILQNNIGKLALRLGWTRTSLGQHDDIKKIFGGNVVRWSIFSPRSWSDEWAIAVTISLAGEKWWVVKLSASAPGAVHSIVYAELLSAIPSQISMTRTGLADIESKSVAQISFSNITKQLRQRKIQHNLGQANAVSTTTQSSYPPKTTILCINFKDMMQPRGAELAQTWTPWCHETMHLTHHGMSNASAGTPKVIHVLKISLTPEAASSLAKTNRPVDNDETDISFSEHGACALRLQSDFGEDLATVIEARLRRIERLHNYIRVARLAEVPLEYASVKRLVFKYHADPALLVELHFMNDGKASVHVRLSATHHEQSDANANPHRRLQPLLQKLVGAGGSAESMTANGSEYKRFAYLLQVITFTLPLLRGIAGLEKADPFIGSIRCSVYDAAHYRLIYTEPFTRAVIDIRLRRKERRSCWLVTVPEEKQTMNAELKQALQELWSSAGEGWIGLSTGAVAEKNGIEGLLGRLNTIMMGTISPGTVQDNGEQAAGDKPEIVVLD